MKTCHVKLAAVSIGVILCLAVVLAAPGVKSYQVTGPVLELTDSSITIQKGDDKWQLARDKNTRVDGQLKVGAKVTIQYQMIATEVEVKGEKEKKTK